jgi:glycosyltransferase involved in cell wall biosynthesis
MPKKIWILNHYAIPPSMPGGTRHYDLSQELIKKNFEVTIFSSGFSHGKKDYFELFKGKPYIVENYGRLKFVWLKTTSYKKNNYKRILNMFSYLFRMLTVAHKFPKPEVIIGSSVHPFAVIAAWLLSKKYKAKFIFEVRDLWPQTPIDMGVIKPNGIIAKLMYTWEKFMYKRADKIIVLLPNAKKYIEGKGISAEKVVWIPNGVNLERFDNPIPLSNNHKIKNIFKKSNNKFVIMYTGAHGPANGLDIFIKAANCFQISDSEIKFYLIGSGIEKERLQKESKKRNLNNIYFFPPVPKKEIPAILNCADLLVQSFAPVDVFKYGISPNKIFDYLAASKPIIMSVKTTNNIVEDAKAGIVVEPGNVKAFIQGIMEIKNMPLEERKKLGENGRAYVEKHYDTRILAEKLEEIL